MNNGLTKTFEAAAEASLRNDLISIKEAGYNRRFARGYLYHRYVTRDGYITADTFNRIVDEFFPN